MAVHATSGGERRIVAVYPYHDEGGLLLCEVVRFEPKKLRPAAARWERQPSLPAAGHRRFPPLPHCGYLGAGRPLSPVDLVRSVLALDTYAALLWLDARSGLPSIPKKRHLSRRQHVSGRAGVNGRLEPVVRSGLLAGLTHAEVRLLVTLYALAAPLTGVLRMSYAGLRQFSGIAKDSTLSKALKRLANLKAIEINKGRGGRGLAETSTYHLTLEDETFLRHLRACHAVTREQIDAQCRIRDERRSYLKTNFPLPMNGSGKSRTTAPERRQYYTGNIAPICPRRESTS